MKDLITRFFSAIGKPFRNPSRRAGALLFACGALTLLPLSPVYAQPARMRATLPFEFRVGDKVLAAGTYIVTVSGSAGSVASHTYQITLTVN